MKKQTWILHLIFALFFSGLFGQDYIPGVVEVRVTDSAYIPHYSGDGYYFDDPFLDNLMSPFNLVDVKQAYSYAIEFDHPFAEPLSRVYTFTCNCDESTLQNTLLTSASSYFDRVDLVGIGVPTYTPNDYGSSGGFPLNSYAMNIIRAQEAWDITKGDPEIEIAVVETFGNGFDTNHEDFENKIGTPAYDPNYPSQIIYVDPSVSPTSDKKHGTGVAGLVAASTDNNTGITAIGFKCKLRLYTGEYNMILKAALDGADVINNSWIRCDYKPNHQEILEMVYDRGVVIVAGSANGNQDTDNACSGGPMVGVPVNGIYYNGYAYPASDPHVISVTSISQSKKYEAGPPITVHSHNDAVDVAAPGFAVLGLKEGSSYGKDRWGTSFASPIVAGLCGLILSVNPCLTPEDVRNILVSTTEDISSIANNSQYYSIHQAGLIDAYEAVDLAQTYIPPTTPSPTIQNGDDIVWNTEIRMADDIVVESGGKLTVQATLKMPPNGRIIVERGGHLIVDGGTISVAATSCGNTWYGIEVWGDRTKPHPPTLDILNANHPDHGAVIIKNGATLTHAQNAVTLVRKDTWGNNLNYSGGIVFADDSHFPNNRRSFEFMKFRPGDHTPNANNRNLSHIRNCNFTHDRYTHFDHSNIAPFITLWAVEGVEINANIFQNNDPTTFSKPYRGKGIRSEDASYSVTPICTQLGNPLPGGGYECLAYDRNEFIDLFRGIEVFNTMMVPDNVTIDRNYFEDCQFGIALAGVDQNAIIIRNEIQMPTTLGSRSTGIYALGSTGFQIEQNTIKQSASPSGDILDCGIVSYNSGSFSNEIYKNEIQDIRNGVWAIGYNLGLQIKCNEYQNVHRFHMIGSNLNTFAVGQIPDQGFCLTDPFHPDYYSAPAGNYINHDCIETNGDFNYINWLSGSSIKYNHHVGNNYLLQCHSTTIANNGCSASFDEIQSCLSGIQEEIDPDERIERYNYLITELGNTDPEDSSYIQYLNKEIQLSTREITQWYLDSNDLSAAIGFLQVDTSTYARSLEIPLLINDQQYEEATQALGGMGTPTPELLAFYNLYSWINEIKEEGREYSEMSSSEEASLRNIAASNTKFAANAQAILWQVFEEEIIFPEPDLEENPLERKANPEYVKDFVFDIFPNPTENKIQIELDLKVENQDKVEIIMLNSVGVELKREQIKSNHYRSTYPVIDLPNGVYYLILKRNDLTIDHKKAVILR